MNTRIASSQFAFCDNHQLIIANSFVVSDWSYVKLNAGRGERSKGDKVWVSKRTGSSLSTVLMSFDIYFWFLVGTKERIAVIAAVAVSHFRPISIFMFARSLRVTHLHSSLSSNIDEHVCQPCRYPSEHSSPKTKLFNGLINAISFGVLGLLASLCLSLFCLLI